MYSGLEQELTDCSDEMQKLLSILASDVLISRKLLESKAIIKFFYSRFCGLYLSDHFCPRDTFP